jgi:transcriptional regulator with XRE-family HTH domain
MKSNGTTAAAKAPPVDTAMRLAGLVRDARRAKGLSLSQVGKAMGRPVHGTYIYKIEQGEKVPRDPELLAELGRVLGIDPETMFWATGQLPPDLARRMPSAPKIKAGFAALRRAVGR